MKSPAAELNAWSQPTLNAQLPPLPPSPDAQEVLHRARRAGDDALAVELHRAAVAVEHEAAAFPHEEDSGGGVPGEEEVVLVHIEATAGGERKSEHGASQHAPRLH